MDSDLDHLGRPIVAITGAGIVSSLGQGVEENWQKLTAGCSGIHTISRFCVEGLRTRIAGTVDFLPESHQGACALSEKMAWLAGHEAITQAGLEMGGGQGSGFGGPLFLAAPPMELDWKSRFALDEEIADHLPASYQSTLTACRQRKHEHLLHTTQFGFIAARLQQAFGTRGLPVTLSTACASGATAIQMGVEAIRRGRVKRALSIGTDGSATAEALIRFSLLSTLSTQNEPPEKASKPFSRGRDGFVLAEGAGALVLESRASARERGAQILAIIAGCGETADDFHRTRSKPDASPAIGAVVAALKDAGFAPDDIDYINAHGTSTPENEKMEYLALSTVFGEGLPHIPVSSNKSMIGHTLTAAGAIEAVFSLLTIRHGCLPPTINYDEPDPSIPLDVVPNVCREKRVRSVLSNSFGFGGQNSTLVIRCA